MNRMVKVFLVSISMVFVWGTCFGQGLVEEIVNQERNRQVSKQTSDVVVLRVATEINENVQEFQIPGDTTFLNSIPLGNPLAASADQGPSGSVWSALSATEISDDHGLGVHLDADIYQLIGGLDKQFGDWFLGSTLTYAYTEAEIGGGPDSTSQTVGLTPYAAYVINNYFFVTGLAGWTYTHTNTDPIGGFKVGDSDSHNYTAEIDLNGLKVIDNWIFKGRLGTRYSHLHTDFELGAPNDFSSDTFEYIGDVETGYLFDSGLNTFIGLQIDYTDNRDFEGDYVLYFRGGAVYSINQALSVGLKISTELNDEDIDILTGTFNMRLAF